MQTTCSSDATMSHYHDLGRSVSDIARQQKQPTTKKSECCRQSARQFRIFPRYIRPLFIHMLLGTVGERPNEPLRRQCRVGRTRFPGVETEFVTFLATRHPMV